MGGVKKFFYFYFGALVLMLTGIGVMGWLGYRLQQEGMVYLLFGILAVSALIALIVFICKRIQIRWLKIFTAVFSGMITLALAALMLVFFTWSSIFALPNYYNSFESPSGKGVVVLREYADESYTAMRYTAYPKAAAFFYNTDKPGEGDLVLDLLGTDELLYEWIDESTFHLFTSNSRLGEHWLKLE